MPNWSAAFIALVEISVITVSYFFAKEHLEINLIAVGWKESRGKDYLLLYGFIWTKSISFIQAGLFNSNWGHVQF